MVSGTSELQQREQALKRIIDSNNLTTTFAELRNDHYRVRTLKARVRVELSSASTTQPQQQAFRLQTITLSKIALNKAPAEVHDVAQFYVASQPTMLINDARSTAGFLVTCEMYAPYEQEIINHSMSTLDGIDTVTLEYGPIGPLPPEGPDQILKDIEAMRQLIKKLIVEIELNGTVINQHEFSNRELELPAERSRLVIDNMVKIDFPKSVGNSYKDVKTLYDARIKATLE